MAELRRCYVCQKLTDLYEEHHLIPQSRGGVDELTVFLCVEHNKKAHYFARSKFPLSIIRNIRLRKIVKIIRLSDKLLEHADTYNMTVVVDKETFKKITSEAKRFKVAKAKLLTKIIQSYFKRKGGA